MFAIEIVDRTYPIGRGRIQLGDFEEAFEISFEYWSPEEYEQQWLNALHRLLTEGGMSALITSVTDPESANFLWWWPAYRDDEVVVFQNAVLLLDDLRESFELSRYEEFIPPREQRTEDGEPISEWHVSTSDVYDFLAQADAGRGGARRGQPT